MLKKIIVGWVEQMTRYRMTFWLSFLVLMITTSAWGQFVTWLTESLASQYADRGIWVALALLILPLVLWVFWFFLSLEIYLKFQFLRALANHPPTLTTPAHWPNLDPAILQEHSQTFEKIGYTWLTDFTYPNQPGLIRLMVHSQAGCMAEIGQLERQPVNVSISSPLEQGWFCFVNTRKTGKVMDLASWWVFFRQPQDLHKRFEALSTAELHDEFLDFRQELCQRLKLQVIPIQSAEQFFGLVAQRRAKARHQIWNKSIVLGYLEMLIFATNPKYEYVGNDLVATKPE